MKRASVAVTRALRARASSTPRCGSSLVDCAVVDGRGLTPVIRQPYHFPQVVSQPYDMEVGTVGLDLEGWGGEELVIRRDPPTGAWILIAIHSTLRGPAVGGTRIRRYPTVSDGLVDVLRLSGGMTVKNAVAGLPCGGAKAV